MLNTSARYRGQSRIALIHIRDELVKLGFIPKAFCYFCNFNIYDSQNNYTKFTLSLLCLIVGGSNSMCLLVKFIYILTGEGYFSGQFLIKGST